MIYKQIYENLCNTRKLLKEYYGVGSGLHRHRIVPGHEGGSYTEENVTFLTPREHVVAHFLLWKMYKNPNDLRSMNMLGAELTFEQRRIIGLWCAENKIGFHKFIGTEYHKEYSLRGLETQKENYEIFGIKDSFYYWSTKEGMEERASLGGSASWESAKKNRNGLPNFLSMDPEVRKRNAKNAAKLSPKFPVTDGIKCIKLYTEQEREEFLSNNPSFRSGGRPYKKKSSKEKLPPKRFWIYREGIVKWTTPDKINEFLKEGWKEGRG